MIRTLTVEYTVQGTIEIEVPDDASEEQTNIIAKNAVKKHLGIGPLNLSIGRSIRNDNNWGRTSHKAMRGR